MRLGREQHKAMVQLKKEWNQPDAAGDNKLNVEKEQSCREKKSKSLGIRGSNLAGKRKAGSSKEQTEEESARVGTEVVGTADRVVRATWEIQELCTPPWESYEGEESEDTGKQEEQQ